MNPQTIRTFLDYAKQAENQSEAFDSIAPGTPLLSRIGECLLFYSRDSWAVFLGERVCPPRLNGRMFNRAGEWRELMPMGKEFFRPR